MNFQCWVRIGVANVLQVEDELGGGSAIAIYEFARIKCAREVRMIMYGVPPENCLRVFTK